jgi:hypothetical protein
MCLSLCHYPSSNQLYLRAFSVPDPVHLILSPFIVIYFPRDKLFQRKDCDKRTSRERERERKRKRDGEREKERETERVRERKREIERERERERARQRE